VTAFVHGGDVCLSLWADAYATGTCAFPHGARVLEIGCAEADWITPMLAVRPDLQITGIDWRPCTRPGTVIQGDVLTHDWPAASFDVMIGVSSIEHIGLGHYDHDPLDVDGDVHAMARVVRWLKPGGWVYLDVPYEPAGYRVEGTSHRVYDDAAVQARLLPGLTLRQRWVSTHDVVCVSVVATKDGP
jgi:Caenorhabditis protein of unknown function, DUF268